jgi:hypothetical protein
MGYGDWMMGGRGSQPASRSRSCSLVGGRNGQKTTVLSLIVHPWIVMGPP